jgi:hypothetical protein
MDAAPASSSAAARRKTASCLYGIIQKTLRGETQGLAKAGCLARDKRGMRSVHSILLTVVIANPSLYAN